MTSAGTPGAGVPDSDAPGRGRSRVILVTGPSGAGKSRLAARLTARLGWPVVRLDDFYREADDPNLPRSPLGIADWDHVDSWNAEAAVAALRELVDEGHVDVPVYDISTSSVIGAHRVAAAPRDLIVAEGLFAGRLVQPLRDNGLLADALCIRQNRWLTAVRRFVRDLAERRKPPHILVRRGWALMRDEPRVIAEAVAQGARCLTPSEAEQQLSAAYAQTGSAAR